MFCGHFYTFWIVYFVGYALCDYYFHFRKMEHNVQGATPRMEWSAHDLPTAFKQFKDHTDFMFGGPLASKTEAVKCNYLMLWVGDKGRQIYSTWDLSEDDRKILSILYERFELYCKPKSNQITFQIQVKIAIPEGW